MKREIQFYNFASWLEEASRLGYEVEEGGDDKLHAHLDGEDRGVWNPNYGGAGYGWFHEQTED